MKKICYITTIPMTLDMFVLESVKYIHDNTDWEITFICDYNQDFANSLPDYIHYHPIKMKRGISISGIKAMWEMKRFFDRERFDLIQYSTPNASLYASLAGKLSGVPVRLYCQWGLAYVGFKGLKRLVFKRVERVVCKMSTWIEPDSNSNLEFSHSEGLYPTDMGSVIGNGSACGVDLEKFNVLNKSTFRHTTRLKYSIPESAFVFGYVGRITRDKGINELFNASKRIINDYDNVYLLMVGPEDNDDSVDKDLYTWSKNSDKVIFTGFTRVVEEMMSAMDCFILPSYREGFGMSVIEAEAMAVPVIVTNIPGPIDGMQNNITGFIIEKKNAVDLELAMRKMMSTEIDYLGNNALVYIRDNFEQKKLFELIVDDRKRLMNIVE